MLLSSESKERAIIQDSDPETLTKEKGIPQTSVFLISTGHCSMVLFTVFFSFFRPPLAEEKSSRQCQYDLQDFKLPLLSDLKQRQIAAWLQRAHLYV